MSPIFDQVTPERIARTDASIDAYIRRTPVIDAEGVALKLESMQHAGSFKTRGAFANLLSRTIPAAGVVAASGGNHGAAVAYAAMTLRVPCKIFVPVVSSPAKIARIQEYGADLAVVGERYADALAASDAFAQESGALRVHAFDQIETLLGQGTLGKELEERYGSVDTVLVAVGGGGLIGGIAAWYAGRAKVIAVEPEGAPTLAAAIAAGEPVDAPAGSIASDSLAPRRVGDLAFEIAARYVERAILVTDDEILAARKALWDSVRIVAEPGGAAAFAAVVSGKYTPERGERVAVIVSGGNTVISWT
ncbi:MAG: threonine/serine dehydratase [Candidatus Baltobacteraceae bacterium]